MTQQVVIEIMTQAIYTLLLLVGPMLLVGLVVGLAISIFQAVTQIHEMTLTFIPKVIAIFLTLVLMLPWILQKFIFFTQELFANIPNFSH